MIEVCLIVPFVPWLQHDLTALSHATHVHALILATRCLAQLLELADKRHHIDEGIIIGLEDVSDVVVGNCILQNEVGLVQNALVVCLVVQKCNVSIGINLLLHLHSTAKNLSCEEKLKAMPEEPVQSKEAKAPVVCARPR